MHTFFGMTWFPFKYTVFSVKKTIYNFCIFFRTHILYIDQYMQQKIQTIDKSNAKSCHSRFIRKLTGFQTLNYTVYVHVSSVTPFVFLILVPK